MTEKEEVMSVKIQKIDLQEGEDLLITDGGSNEVALAIQKRNGKFCVGGPINNRCKNFLITEKGWKKIKRSNSWI